jgi:hypothetical protein
MTEPVVAVAAAPFKAKLALIPIATVIILDDVMSVMLAYKPVVFTVLAVVGTVIVSVILTPSASTPLMTKLPDWEASEVVTVTYCGG